MSTDNLKVETIPMSANELSHRLACREIMLTPVKMIVRGTMSDFPHLDKEDVLLGLLIAITRADRISDDYEHAQYGLQIGFILEMLEALKFV